MGSAFVLHALAFAAEKHKLQRRKGNEGIPYINHCIRVANCIAKYATEYDDFLLAAAILHDTVEDTDTTEEELIDNFGEKVAAIVLEVTDDMTLTKMSRRKLQVQHASSLSAPAKKLKIADKTCNIKDLMNYSIDWDNQRKLDYVEWAKAVVDQVRGTDIKLESKFDEIVQMANEKFN